jgi:hypothetical protein
MNCLGRFQDSGRGKSWNYFIFYSSQNWRREGIDPTAYQNIFKRYQSLKKLFDARLKIFF